MPDLRASLERALGGAVRRASGGNSGVPSVRSRMPARGVPGVAPPNSPVDLQDMATGTRSFIFGVDTFDNESRVF